MRRALMLVPALLLLLAAGGRAAPPPPRPDSGCGVLLLEPAPGAERIPLVFYREPGVNRIAELDASSLPRLSGSAAHPLVAVTGRKGGWTRLPYDGAGREAWIEQERSWRYLSWPEFLPGRLVRLLPGMKKGCYALRGGPGEKAPETGSLTRDQGVRVVEVEGDWARLEAPSGWLRWRDGDGRLTIAPQ